GRQCLLLPSAPAELACALRELSFGVAVLAQLGRGALSCAAAELLQLLLRPIHLRLEGSARLVDEPLCLRIAEPPEALAGRGALRLVERAERASAALYRLGDVPLLERPRHLLGVLARSGSLARPRVAPAADAGERASGFADALGMLLHLLRQRLEVVSR